MTQTKAVEVRVARVMPDLGKLLEGFEPSKQLYLTAIARGANKEGAENIVASFGGKVSGWAGDASFWVAVAQVQKEQEEYKEQAEKGFDDNIRVKIDLFLDQLITTGLMGWKALDRVDKRCVMMAVGMVYAKVKKSEGTEAKFHSYEEIIARRHIELPAGGGD